MWYDGNWCSGTELEVRLSTTIGELKKMKIFDNGRRKCPPDSFTLADAKTQKELADDDTVAGIPPFGSAGNGWLNFYSCSYYIQREGSSQPPVYETFFNDDFRRIPYWSNVISAKLNSQGRRMHSHTTLPGGTILCH